MISLAVLGSTGSIGTNTLAVAEQYPERFSIYALSAHQNAELLTAQCLHFRPQYAVVGTPEAAAAVSGSLKQAGCPTEVLYGADNLCRIASDPQVDAVMAAIVGAAGLRSALAAARAGKTIYLANKETLVVSGSLFIETAEKNGARVLPVDSEHNAIYQVLPENPNGTRRTAEKVQSLILTASGGPFRHMPASELSHVSPEQALRHPNWQMGKKISIDSATLMNKGLELIEAHWLFDCPPEKLEVAVHPQSIVHSMVRYTDGSVLAQTGVPDMRIPIAYCMGFPERISSGAAALDLFSLPPLTFERPDVARFPCLNLAYDAMREQGLAPCILNAANEVAVAAFLQRRIGFDDIPAIIAQCMAADISGNPNHVDDLEAVAFQAARLAESLIATRRH